MAARLPYFALLVCCLGVMVLCGLGVWQLQRLQWKTELQHKIDMLMAEPDVPQLSVADFQLQDRNDLRRGLVFARFFLSQAVYLNGYLEDGVTRYPVLVPARLENGGQNFVAVLWVDQKKRSKDWAGKEDLDWAMTGMTRLPDLSVFRPTNNPDQEEWWQIDVQQLADYWGFRALRLRSFMPKIHRLLMRS